MSSMIEVSAADLEGTALDWAVARATGTEVVIDTVPGKTGFDVMLSASPITYYSPSTDWSQGGPLIESIGVDLCCLCECQWSATADNIIEAVEQGINESEGPTPLIAAMRAIVAAELGDDVEVPAELVEAK